MSRFRIGSLIGRVPVYLARPADCDILPEIDARARFTCCQEMHMLERWPRPLLIGETGEPQLLQAATVGKPPFSERELQVILARYPQLLPVAHFDPLFGPPVCIGRETGTGAGPLDLLYVSPSGYLTLVGHSLD